MAAISETGHRAIAAGMDPAEWDLRVQLAAAYRINNHLGWEDSINTHTSVRLPGAQHHFLINPFGLRFDEIKASNLVKVDLDGQIVALAGVQLSGCRRQPKCHTLGFCFFDDGRTRQAIVRGVAGLTSDERHDRGD